VTTCTQNAVLVYDVGGSHVTAAICQLDSGCYRLASVVSAPHPTEQTSDAFIQFLHSLGAEAAPGADGIVGAGLAFPGPFDYNAGISLAKHKLPFLFEVDLRSALAARFGWQTGQIRFINDAAAFLLGEIGAGAAHGIARSVGITLGTGIGSAFALDGHIVSEGSGVPSGGEIWNLPYESGIVEDYLSTRAIQGNYKNRTGKLLQVREIADLAAKDQIAVEVFAEFGRHLGVALRKLLTPFAPQVIVIGGGIARSPHLFLPAAQRELEGLSLDLKISELFDRAALVGAGVAWFDAANCTV
jgi:glucokinase